MPVIGEDPDSELGRLGFLYATNPMQHSVSGTVLLGVVKWGGATFGNAAFGSIRTSDPDPSAARGQAQIPAVQPWAEAASLEQTGGLGTHASK